MKKDKKLYMTLAMNSIVTFLLSLIIIFILHSVKDNEGKTTIIILISAITLCTFIFYFINLITVKDYIHREIALREERDNELIDEMKKESKCNNHLVFSSYHEFLSCITYIMGFTQINKMKISKLNEEIEDMSKLSMIKEEFQVVDKNFNMILEEVNRLKDIIENIVELTSIEIRLENFNRKSIDIKEIINRSILSTYSIMEEKELEIIEGIDDNILEIEVDEEKITKVINILLYKVIENTTSHKIYCSVQKEEGDIIVSIGQWNIEKIHKEDIELKLCRSIIENHKGKLWIKSVKGIGDAVVFTLPKGKR